LRGFLIALAVIGGTLLLTRRGPVDDAPELYVSEDGAGDWWVVEGDTIVCGPLPLEANALDSMKRWKSTRHC
jgi:hypothetical protein